MLPLGGMIRTTAKGEGCRRVSQEERMIGGYGVGFQKQMISKGKDARCRSGEV